MSQAAIAVPRMGSGLMRAPRDSGSSASAVRLQELEREALHRLMGSISVRSQLDAALGALDSVFQEAAEPGWNGYNAKPVSSGTYLNARRFLEALPTTGPYPDISADGDGDISLDWFFAPRKAVSVSVASNRRLAFALVDGCSTSRGVEWLVDGIPSRIADAIADLARQGER